MSTRNKQGTWVVPKEQVEEFMSGPINWNKLIEECIKQPEHRTFDPIVEKPKKKTKTKTLFSMSF